jgi:peptide deformylase
MAIRTIRKWNDSILHKKSRDVTAFDRRLHQLLDDMADTMREANGVGLAAVQVGALRRVVTIDVGDGVVELINPVITETSEETIDMAEGCLSFPGQQGMVERPKRVTVEAFDRNGEPFTITGEDLLARALCHEIDHTNGIVYLDIATEILEDEDDEDE